MHYFLALVPRQAHGSQAARSHGAKHLQAQSRHLHPVNVVGCCTFRFHPSPSLIQFLFQLQPSLLSLLILPVFLITSTQLHCYSAPIYYLQSFGQFWSSYNLHATKDSLCSESSVGRRGSEFTGCRKQRYLCVNAKKRCKRAQKAKSATRHSFGMQLTQALFHVWAPQLEKTVFKEGPLLGAAATFQPNSPSGLEQRNRVNSPVAGSGGQGSQSAPCNFIWKHSEHLFNLHSPSSKAVSLLSSPGSARRILRMCFISICIPNSICQQHLCFCTHYIHHVEHFDEDSL